jgi:hypothetical protein
MKSKIVIMALVLGIMMSCGGGVGEYSNSYLKSRGLTSEQIKSLKNFYASEWKSHKADAEHFGGLIKTKEDMWNHYGDYIEELVRADKAANDTLAGIEPTDSIGWLPVSYFKDKGLDWRQIEKIRKMLIDYWSINRGRLDDSDHSWRPSYLSIMQISYKYWLENNVIYEVKFPGISDEGIKVYNNVRGWIEGDNIKGDQKRFKEKITPNLEKLPALFKKYEIKVPNWIFAQILTYVRSYYNDTVYTSICDNYNYLAFNVKSGYDTYSSGLDKYNCYKFSDLESFVKTLMMKQEEIDSEHEGEFVWDNYWYRRYLTNIYSKDYADYLAGIAAYNIDMWDPNYDWGANFKKIAKKRKTEDEELQEIYDQLEKEIDELDDEFAE